jgi:hypothetical protein
MIRVEDFLAGFLAVLPVEEVGFVLQELLR